MTQAGSVFKKLVSAVYPTNQAQSSWNEPSATRDETKSPATPPITSSSHSASTVKQDIRLTEAELRQNVAADHAWIRQNLDLHYRVRQPTSLPDSLPEPEPMDEEAIRARLLKIHGGRIPGRAGRRVSTSTQDVVPLDQATRILPASLTEPLRSTPAVITNRPPLAAISKPRASVVKPAATKSDKVMIPQETGSNMIELTAQSRVKTTSIIESSSCTSTIPVTAIEEILAPCTPLKPESLPQPAASVCADVPTPLKNRVFREISAWPGHDGTPTIEDQQVLPSTRKPISASFSAPRPPKAMTAAREDDATYVRATSPSLVVSPIPPTMPVRVKPEDTVPLDEQAFDTFDEPPQPTPVVVQALSAVTPVSDYVPESVADGESQKYTAPVMMQSTESPPFVSRKWNEYAPSLNMLQAPSGARTQIDLDILARNSRLIEQRLADFRVNVLVRDACAGPVITRYEVEPAVGVRGAQVVNLMKDLARALSVTSIRVVETIPGKSYMGLELPNEERQTISLSEVLSSDIFQHHPSKLAMALGKDITGEPVVTDLAKAPHMLVAGTTGSGKSVGVNAMIVSLLYRANPDEVRFLMIDPKMLELSVYDGIPHLLAPVVTDMKLAANALHWCVTEMERRYRLMSMLGVRNLASFNQKIREAQDTGHTIYDPEPLIPESPTPLSALPFIVVVVDEFADLMMVAGKKIEELIARLAQKARAAGIHLILATQRPSVDVITGLIKANIPTRIAFQVSSKIDSRTILDQMGAETLLGQGDMLYLPPGTGYPQRVHGAFVGDDEVHRLVEHLKQWGVPDYIDAVLVSPGGNESEASGTTGGTESDPLYDQAVSIVVESRRASISLVQRQLRIGYNRAARLVEQMEIAGIVSPMESNGSRTVLVP